MKKIICFAFAAMLLSGCVDLLQKPQSQIFQETIELNEDILGSMCNGMYKDWWGENFGYNCRLASLAVAGDDMIVGDITKTRVLLNDQMSAAIDSPDVSTLWKWFYKAIFSANNIIALIEANDKLDHTVTDKYLGEARFIRALMYFYVVRLWGDAPAITDPQSTADIDGDESIPRKSVKDIYERIIVPDAIAASELLEGTGRTVQAPTSWAAKTLLADVYLNMAGWPMNETGYYAEAAAVAKDVVENSPHSLMPEYRQLWQIGNVNNTTEHIFALHHSLTYLPSQYGISYLGYEEGGWSDYAADPVFFESFPDDTRKEFCFVTSTEDKTTSETVQWEDFDAGAPYIRKYRGFGGCGQYGIEGNTAAASQLSEGLTPIYRYADALLFYAEAVTKATGNPDDLARECLRKVRARAMGDPDYVLPQMSADEFEDAVFDEFGWENVFEFKRWFQLVRTDRVDEMVSKNPDIGARVNANRQNYLFPLPVRQVELRKWQNNPGY